MTPTFLKEKAKPIKQAFGSPGGKTYLAPKIVNMLPPHEVYVEPFAGGAAVYFKKSPSKKEVLSDKDKEIAFAFRFLRDMTPEQFERLRQYDWVKRRSLFERLKKGKPSDDVERFRRFYYLKKASFGHGSRQFSPGDEGGEVGINHLWKVRERLKKTAIHGGEAIAIIRKYDSPTTFHFVDPPYPDRAFIGAPDKYTVDDLQRLIGVLRNVKGKFILTLGTEHAKYLPKSWHIKRVGVRRTLIAKYTGDNPLQYEIIATNYNPDAVKIQPRIVKDMMQEPLTATLKNNAKMPKEVAAAIGSYDAKVTPEGKVKLRVKRIYERPREEEVYRCGN